jgi:Spy/CpxP family protein refolding chaperone
MTWFQSTRSRYGAVGLGSAILGFLLAWPLFASAQDKKDPPADPAAKHAAMPTDKDLAEQIKLLNAKVARLEAALPQDPKGTPPATPVKVNASSGQDKTGAPSGYRVASKYQNCVQCHQSRPSTPLPASHLEKTADTTMPAMAGMPGMTDPPKPDGGMPGMADKAKPAGMGMGMMDMMTGGKKEMAGMGMGMMDGDKMMEMKKMMMGGMGDKTMGGGMGMGMMGDMDMMGMMGMGSMGGAKDNKMKMASALPGFPGASHIYHIGASDFFLDHPQHITLTTEQETRLVKMKQMTLTTKASGQRKIEEAEQQLWELTASDQPDVAKLEAKVREVEKLRGDQRMAFIRSVGEAAQALTEEQRKILIGQATTAPPPSTTPASPLKTP